MPVSSSVQLKSGSIGRGNPAYSPGKQLICRREGFLALVLPRLASADQGSGPRPSLFLSGSSQQPLSLQRTPPSMVGNTRRRIAHDPAPEVVFTSGRQSSPFRNWELPRSALDDKVEPLRREREPLRREREPPRRERRRTSRRHISRRHISRSSRRPRRVDPKPRFPARPAVPCKARCPFATQVGIEHAGWHRARGLASSRRCESSRRRSLGS
ncbi:hypothetical protein GGP93_001246 [Salinibacter ruber]|nr:hypothetical protein [Salinibacter ruber]